MKRELRYIVLKIKDVNKALSPKQENLLQELCGIVDAYRHTRGKNDLECVVVENDWPEYEPVWKMLEKRFDNERSNNKPQISDICPCCCTIKSIMLKDDKDEVTK